MVMATASDRLHRIILNITWSHVGDSRLCVCAFIKICVFVEVSYKCRVYNF
jgi:hypothetical protein